MIVTFRADAWRDYLAWQREDAKVLERINTQIIEAMRDPFCGTGKPELLKKNFAGS